MPNCDKVTKIEQKRQIWIFFDEINTCNSMGLLSEILCHNSIRGKKISERFVFIAACNPYRLLSKESQIENILYHKNSKKKKISIFSKSPSSFIIKFCI